MWFQIFRILQSSPVLMPVLINTKKCTPAQICTAFESYLAILGQIAQKCCANSRGWTPDTYWASSIQHLHSRMLAYINECHLFCVAHSRTLFILENSVSIVSFLPFLRKLFFYGFSFTMSASTANIAKKKATNRQPLQTCIGLVHQVQRTPA
jgi:hypothetical protein